ncbi:archaetidylserine decarboxylase [Legionella impletisoli]|uniref:Phosphatidylserine decarboxylase proenzyme n=1 Tax=Legionella impletisoli TaxID=343510 RepID=A0A917JU08_9GAMM|nr:archaetidylserine decarboxylase [Legionella impletisoli]GGI84787.1 phosphatidylserine decarboxylase proenzyme [Legionella impletisoli]
MLTDHFKTFPQYVIPKHSLTTLAGLLANVKTPAIKNHLIKTFIRRYNINMQESLVENPEHYETFNDFFIRHLKPECRPVSNAHVVSPVDGYVSEIGQIKTGKLVQAKGRNYSIEKLLASEQSICHQFSEGKFATLYLSPKDYHRVHMPMKATLKEMTYVPGKLFSVQPSTTRVIRNLFAQNERLVVLFDTDLGPMAMVLVGATIVGGIGTAWHGDIKRCKKQTRFIYPASNYSHTELDKSQEMGYFKLGSTVILLFSNHCPIEWETTLHNGSRIQLGEPLARVK